MRFILEDHEGRPRRMRDGSPFVYSEKRLARAAKLLFEAGKDCVTVYRIVEVAA